MRVVNSLTYAVLSDNHVFEEALDEVRAGLIINLLTSIHDHICIRFKHLRNLIRVATEQEDNWNLDLVPSLQHLDESLFALHIGAAILTF